MCTVSFVNNNGKIVITSNRDEKVSREVALKPKIYVLKNKKVIFPKDKKAGGTWYGIDEKSNVVVLLNGAKEKHIIKSSYKKSRGLIVLDIIGADSLLDAWIKINLNEVEPFTLIVLANQKLYQLQWDEIEKHTKELDVTKNHIWSSSTLYSSDIRILRETWFNSFLNLKTEVSESDMFHFHKNTQKENQEFGLVVNRNNILKTLSITQTIIQENKVSLTYFDLVKNKEFKNSFIVI